MWTRKILYTHELNSNECDSCNIAFPSMSFFVYSVCCIFLYRSYTFHLFTFRFNKEERDPFSPFFYFCLKCSTKWMTMALCANKRNRQFVSLLKKAIWKLHNGSMFFYNKMLAWELGTIINHKKQKERCINITCKDNKFPFLTIYLMLI